MINNLKLYQLFLFLFYSFFQMRVLPAERVPGERPLQRLHHGAGLAVSAVGAALHEPLASTGGRLQTHGQR